MNFLRNKTSRSSSRGELCQLQPRAGYSWKNKYCLTVLLPRGRTWNSRPGKCRVIPVFRGAAVNASRWFQPRVSKSTLGVWQLFPARARARTSEISGSRSGCAKFELNRVELGFSQQASYDKTYCFIWGAQLCSPACVWQIIPKASKCYKGVSMKFLATIVTFNETEYSFFALRRMLVRTYRFPLLLFANHNLRSPFFRGIKWSDLLFIKESSFFSQRESWTNSWLFWKPMLRLNTW